VYGVHRYLPAAPAALFRWDALELAASEHLPYAVGGEPQDPGSLINRVEALLHTGILPLEWGFALVIRRQLRSFKPSLGIFREMTVLGDRVDKRSWGAVKQPLHLR
jgi:hypothetical protein